MRLLGAGLGRDAIGAVALDADSAQNAAEDSEADAGHEEDKSVREVAGEVGEQEDPNAGVNKYGEDLAESASRHGVPPGEEDARLCGPLGAQSTVKTPIGP
jgi:hypothetical protein